MTQNKFKFEMQVIYDLSIDRFFVFRNDIDKKDKYAAKKINGNEYYRYIPINGLSIEAVNTYLASTQHEVCFEITDRCTFSCPVCISESKQIGGTSLSIKQFEDIIQNLPKSIVRLTLTGGEPTLYKNIEDIINISTQKFRSTILSTNGYHPQQLEALIKGKSNLIIAISLHGPEAVHDKFVGKSGAYKKAIKSIKLAIDNHCYTHIYTTATSMNINFLPSLFEILSEIPFVEHRINLVKKIGRINDAYVEYNVVDELVSKTSQQSRITIKKQGQPFIFVDCHGMKELKNVW